MQNRPQPDTKFAPDVAQRLMATGDFHDVGIDNKLQPGQSYHQTDPGHVMSMPLKRMARISRAKRGRCFR
jgi:hypothetical protein